jgi:DNA repair protein RecO (recombination protein O)
VSEIVKDRAVVLRTYPFGESSTIAVVLTRTRGKVRLLGKGARRGKSPLSGSLATGTVCEIVFYAREERGLQLVKEIEAAPAFESATADLERLCILQAGLEIVDRSVVERSADEQLFDLLETFMRLLSHADDPWALFFAFEVGLLKIAGSFPSIRACGRCGRELDGVTFAIDAASGAVTCAACRDRGARPLSRSAAEALSRMERTGLDGVERLTLGSRERKEIGELIHDVFANHIDGYRLPSALRLCKGVNGE